MSNHIKGNWFVSVFQMVRMTNEELDAIEKSMNYRYTTRRNAALISKPWRMQPITGKCKK